jgi:hypothetical protein
MHLLKKNLFAVFLGFLSASALAQGKVRIIVSVDWEGDDLQAQNLNAMRTFRSDYPAIPLQHFLNAAYYTKSGAVARNVTQQIQSVLRPGDEHGLHVHAWRTLVTAAGVHFRTSPSFVEGTVDLNQCDPDCGNDVALVAYTEAELKKILNFSVQTLVNQGFNRARSFRAGGWMANGRVLNALADSGFTLDSSATYAPYLEEAWSDYNLYSFVGQLWPNSVPTSQPYVYQAKSGATITELPNNGSLADYVTGADILKAFQSNAALLRSNPASDVYLSIGFHQETAADYLPALRSGIDQIMTYAKNQGIAYEFIVAPL